MSQKNLNNASNVKNILLEQNDKINKINEKNNNVNEDLFIQKNKYNSLTSWIWWFIPLYIQNYFKTNKQDIIEIEIENENKNDKKNIVMSDDILDNIIELKTTSIEIGKILDKQNKNLSIINNNIVYSDY
jgi:hypothetical protein